MKIVNCNYIASGELAVLINIFAFKGTVSRVVFCSFAHESGPSEFSSMVSFLRTYSYRQFENSDFAVSLTPPNCRVRLVVLYIMSLG